MVEKKNFPLIRKQIETKDLALHHYMLKHVPMGLGYDDALNNALLAQNPPFTYFTDSVAPMHVMTALNTNKHGEVMYTYQQDYSVETVKNLAKAEMLCRTAIYCPVVWDGLSATQILFSLWDLRYIVDRVDIVFTPLTKAQVNKIKNGHALYVYNKQDKKYHLKAPYKLHYYIALHECLARWRIQLCIVCDSPAEMVYIKEQGVKKANYRGWG